jgi:arylsulfatase A-like enzyme
MSGRGRAVAARGGRRRDWLGGLCAVTLSLLAAIGCGGGDHVVAPYSGELDGLDTLFDFAARVRSARVLHETGRIDPGSAANRGLLVAGWGRPEVDPATGKAFVWAISLAATLEVNRLQPAATTLRFVCRPFVVEGAPSQTVEVIANGVPVGAVTLARRTRSYSVQIPAERLRPGRNRLELRFAYAESPSRLDPGSDDQRTLAAAFEEFELRPVAGARSGDSAAPTAGPGGLVLPAGTGLAFTVVPEGEVILDLGAGDAAEGVMAWFGAPGGDKQIVGRSRGGYRPVAIRWPDGRPLEIGFAAAGAAGSGQAVVVRPRLLGRDARVRKPPNLLLIVVDTLRADYVGAYREGARTPAIDALAATGTLFERTYAHIAITGPSHASLFTSLLPFEHGVRNNAQILDGSARTLAELLRDHGWMTAAVVSLGVLKREFGFDQGFDHFHDDFGPDWMKDAGQVTAEATALVWEQLAEPYFLFAHYSDPHEPYTPPDLDYPWVELELDGRRVGALQANGRSSSVPLELGPGAHTLRFRARQPAAEPARFYKMDAVRLDGDGLAVGRGSWEVLASAGSPPTYQSRLPATLELLNGSGAGRAAELHLSFKQRLDIPEVRVRYGQEVEYADRQIGGLLQALRSRGLLDNTLIVITSDHGEGLGYHNHVGHIHQVYDTLLRVPLVVSYPGVVPAGKRIGDVVSLIDVFPTVAELLGVEAPAPASGRSLMPLLRGQPIAPRAVLAATYRPEAFTDKQAIISDDFKYIHSRSPEREWEELYDLVADPDELADLITSRAEVAERLRAALAERLAASTEGSAVAVELSEPDRDRLRALGYVH